MDLDELLTLSAPPVATRGDAFARGVEEVITKSWQESVRRRRARLRGLIAAGITAPVVFGSSVAAATGVFTHVRPFSTASGGSCDLNVSVEPRRDGAGAPTNAAGERAQKAALMAAQHYVATIDVNAIDRPEAADRWFDYMQRVSVGRPSRAELEERFQGEQLETHAVLYAVDMRLNDYLRGLGFDPRIVVATVASKCGQ